MASPVACAPGPRAFLQSADELMFASCLDNARKCFLVLKCVYLPLLIVCGAVMAVLNALWFFGHTPAFSMVSTFAMCAQVIVIGIPTVLVPPLLRLNRVPSAVRFAVANTLFAAVCLLVPLLNAHRVWRRQYQEINGFLLIHELLPSAPPRVRPAAVLPHEPLSICADNMFLSLFVFDHASMSFSNFVLWYYLELPRNFFVVSFSLHSFHFWASAYRITGIHAVACSAQPKSAHVHSFPDVETIQGMMQPVLHVLHLSCLVFYLLTKAFIKSPNRKENQKWVQSLLEEAVSSTKVHALALLRQSNHAPSPQRPASFCSRMEFLQSPGDAPATFILPASVGSALKMCASLNEFSTYVGAPALPIQYATQHLPHLQSVTT